VVFVHGTFSSPVWWAEMWNTLRADPVLRERCQFWNFIYPSGRPVPVSAARLRDEINRKLAQLDPAGTDTALRQMVVIGHSQGGLLTKLTATETGDSLWRAVSDADFERLPISVEERENLRQFAFFSPLSAVKRVVFISTPHRGSYLATSFVRGLAARFIRIPDAVVDSAAKVLALQSASGLTRSLSKRVPTSLDGMSPRNPWLLALAELPTAPHVTAHSIIAIKGNEKPPEGSDGVVKYRSAHAGYADSEFLVRSGHSCQDKPAVIEEVRRILLEHLAELATEAEDGSSDVRP
jgi:pimeloyl-ACP methyl ester carboxylesterase